MLSEVGQALNPMLSQLESEDNAVNVSCFLSCQNCHTF